MKYIRGFTLMEILVTIAIISALIFSSFSSFSTGREKARVAARVSHMKEVQNAVEYYYAVNRTYPSTAGSLRSECSNWGSYVSNNVIPGVVPVYLQRMPKDPQMDTAANTSCYIYVSNGQDYAFIVYDVPELSTAGTTHTLNL
jgi:prepilin-type N-terminal cleavage/methylation domain-containing protein